MAELNVARLGDAMLGILERMAFVLAEVPEEHPPDLLSSLDLHGRISFSHGDTGGQLILSASMGFGAELASSLLGLEPAEVSPELAAQALDELCNVTVGEVVMLVGGQEQPFVLTLPERIEPATAAAGAVWGGPSESLQTVLQSEGGWIAVVVAVSSELTTA